MSQLKSYISFFIFCALAKTASAQSMIPMTSTMRTPMGNVPYTYYAPGPSYYHYHYNPASSARHKFVIELKNDSTINASSKILIDDDHHDYLKVKINKTRRIIKPTDTKSIFRQLYDGRKLVGIPTDSCWLFKVRAGKINLYSFLAEENLYTVIAMQVGDGPIVKISKEPLLAIMGDITSLRKLVEKGEFVRAIERYNDDYYKNE